MRCIMYILYQYTLELLCMYYYNYRKDVKQSKKIKVGVVYNCKIHDIFKINNRINILERFNFMGLQFF